MVKSLLKIRLTFMMYSSCSFFIAVPASPPDNFQATAASSTSVTITWDPPPVENQNGIITGYFIDVEAIETGETFQLFSESNTLHVDTLRPFTTYVCIIAAQTSIGIGPYSTSVTVITPEDGEFSL